MKYFLFCFIQFLVCSPVFAVDSYADRIHEEMAELAAAVAANPTNFVFYRKSKDGKDWGVVPYWSSKPTENTVQSVNNKLKTLSGANKSAIVYFSYLYVEYGMDNSTLNKKIAALKKTIAEDANFVKLNQKTGLLWVIKIDRRMKDNAKAKQTIWVEYQGKADMESKCTDAINTQIASLIKEKKVNFVLKPDATIQTYTDVLVKELEGCKEKQSTTNPKISDRKSVV